MLWNNVDNGAFVDFSNKKSSNNNYNPSTHASREQFQELIQNPNKLKAIKKNHHYIVLSPKTNKGFVSKLAIALACISLSPKLTDGLFTSGLY